MNTASEKILFLTLKVFSATGGIEKVCRVAGKAMYEYGLQNNLPVQIMSMHDGVHAAQGNCYFPAEIFAGFGASKSAFMIEAVNAGARSGTVILSHINLLLAGWLIKKTSPATRVIVMAHGIEVWSAFKPHKLKMLNACDQIVSVSSFTEKKLQEIHGTDPAKCSVLNNCIDPYLLLPEDKEKNMPLMKRYGITAEDKVVFTLTRLTEKDRYKGYDIVLESMVKLIRTIPNLKYLLAGSYDKSEKEHLDQLITRFGLEGHVVLTGFIKEAELPAHFSLADLYVMPSIKEGFGIVFVEAMYYGLPVIAGNADGSTDALLHGRLGILIKPNAPQAITDAVEKIFADPAKWKPDHKLLMDNFGYEAYKNKLELLLNKRDGATKTRRHEEVNLAI